MNTVAYALYRYMPGYELFMDGLHGQRTPWHGRGLRIILDENRTVVTEETF